MTAKVSESMNVYGGVQYSNYQWEPIGKVSPTFEASPPSFEGIKKASVTAYAKAEVAVGVFGVTAPKCALSGGLKADADPSLAVTPNPWWDLNGIVWMDAGVDIRIFNWYSYSYNATIFNASIPLCDSNHPQCHK